MPINNPPSSGSSFTGGLITTNLERAASAGADGLTLSAIGIARTGASSHLPLALAAKGNGGVTIGTSNTAIGNNAVAMGTSNDAGSSYSTAVGRWASATLYGQFTQASGGFTNQGDAQFSRVILRAETNDETPTEMYMDGASARIIVPSGKVLGMRVTLVAYNVSGAGYFMTSDNVVAMNIGGTTTISGGEPIALPVASFSGVTYGWTANDPTDEILITVTGLAATQIRWVATVEMTEVALF